MAYVTFDIDKLKLNFEYLNNLFEEHGIKWSVVTKVLSGNKKTIDRIAEARYQSGVRFTRN